jgi:hypothetical protein
MKWTLTLSLAALAAACKMPAKRCDNPGAEPRMSPRLAAARQADYDKNYDLALQETWDVVKYRGDPDPTQARMALVHDGHVLRGSRSHPRQSQGAAGGCG